MQLISSIANKLLLAIFIAASVVTVYSTAAHAEPDGTFDCLLAAKNRVLTWNSKWQRDEEDNGIGYTVTSTASEYNNGAVATVLLELETGGPAVKLSRYISVKDAKTAKSLCKALDTQQARQRSLDNDEFQKKKKLAEAVMSRHTESLRPEEPAAEPVHDDVDSLPFISYTSKGWERSDPPPRKPMTVCQVLSRKFLCLEDEKKRFGKQLHDVEEELSADPGR